ncbi:MAG TPA: Veg protein [Clostridia bacterium]|nr:Veg family protein [Clostridia bacterium]MDD2433466.1 Veg family protein [Clostridia bacterium]HHY05909.1 Veg protein [Clostridia bacterium]
MLAKKVFADIKRDLEPFVGNKIKLKANRGRKKIIEKVGVLESTYPNIFVIRLDEKQVKRRISFTYADILTDTVQLTVFDGDENIRITANGS